MSLLLLFAFACVDPDDSSGKDTDTADTADTADDTDTSIPTSDADGDGHADDVDCDDTDATVHPGAPETCDGRDEDCDGVVDDDAETAWYPDRDGDGFGSAGEDPVYACEAPAGYVADATDCGDGHAYTHPGAVERCDYEDDDCDGEYEDVDETDMTLFRDADGDGAGDSAAPWDVCSAITDTTGYSPEDGDCDDADPAIGPHAEEICDDGVDDNCDGVDSVCPVDVVSMADADVKLLGGGYDAYTDYWSVGFVARAGDVNADGFADLLVADDDGDSDAGANNGTAHLILGGPTLSSGPLSSAAAARYAGPGGGAYGFNWVSGAGDVDGDGFDDLLLGSERRNEVYVIRGEATPGDRLTSEADAVWEGASIADSAGYAVAAAGDFDGDGRDDFVVSAPSAGDGTSTYGALYIVAGPSALRGGSLGDMPAIRGEPDRYPWVAAGAGDVDGDGLDDLVAGSQDDGTAGMGAGAAYLVLGSAGGGDRALATDATKYTGAAEMDAAGNAVAGGGDANADGYADLLVSAMYNDAGGTDAGAVYVLLGGPSPTSGSLADADAVILGQAGDRLAATAGPPLNPLAFAGDVDGDGDDDFLVGAVALGNGGVYVVYGDPALSSHIAASQDTLIEDDARNGVGISVAGPGDVNGDGTADLLFSAEHDDEGGTDVGAAWLMFGPLR